MIGNNAKILIQQNVKQITSEGGKIPKLKKVMYGNRLDYFDILSNQSRRNNPHLLVFAIFVGSLYTLLPVHICTLYLKQQ